MSFSSAFSHASGGRHRLGLALAVLFPILAFGCFNDPNIDPTQTRHCKDDKSCPWGSICATNGICCESADGKTCKALPPAGGLDAPAIDSFRSTGYDVGYDGTGGALGWDGSTDTVTDLPMGGSEAGTGGMPGTGGTGVIDAPGTDTVDVPLTFRRVMAEREPRRPGPRPSTLPRKPVWRARLAPMHRRIRLSPSKPLPPTAPPIRS